MTMNKGTRLIGATMHNIMDVIVHKRLLCDGYA